MFRTAFRGLALIVLTTFFACGDAEEEHDHGGDVIDAGPVTTSDGGQVGITEVSCASTAPSVTVTTPGDFFQPKTSSITTGQVVKFDPAPSHDVVSDIAGQFGVSLAGEGCFRFDAPGTYAFHCRPHGFQGTIIVQ